MKEVEVKYQCGYRGVYNELFDTKEEAILSIKVKSLEGVKRDLENWFYDETVRSRNGHYKTGDDLLKQVPKFLDMAKKAITLEKEIRDLMDFIVPLSKEEGSLIVPDPRKPNGFFRRLIRQLTGWEN